jgi:transcriptional regulator with XRE-family HTH domain
MKFELRKPEVHPTKAVFDKSGYPRSVIAKAIGIEPAYLSSILNGSRDGSPKVNEKLYALAEQLKGGAE